jgi:hypothetical protein
MKKPLNTYDVPINLDGIEGGECQNVLHYNSEKHVNLGNVRMWI